MINSISNVFQEIHIHSYSKEIRINEHAKYTKKKEHTMCESTHSYIRIIRSCMRNSETPHISSAFYMLNDIFVVVVVLLC